MNRQNNLKIIITTVIVLVISAMVVFTIVNWAEIKQKFNGAAAKVDGMEKHERNTVLSNTNSLSSNNTRDEWKDIPSSKEEPKSFNEPSDQSNSKNSPPLEDSTKKYSKNKETDPYGLEEPPTIKPKNSLTSNKNQNNDDYSGIGESNLANDATNYPEKKVHLSKSKKHSSKKTRRYAKTYRGSKVKNLDKRVRVLEKKLGVKSSASTKKTNLEKRIYRLEKIIAKKKK